MVVNISKNSEYHTQRNNIFHPQGSCNTTASINALRASNIDFDCPEGMQAEDYLTQILDTKESWDRMRRNFPWAIKGGYHPRHIHYMLEWAINKKLVGREVDNFHLDVSIKEILFHVLKNECAVNVNGRFTDFGHIVTVVGFKTFQDDLEYIYSPQDIDLKFVESIIIDDPYGNWHTGYNDPGGNDIEFSLEQFDWLTKNYNDENNKWGHLFLK